jgi:glycosyltransferase involved in cell wall biosynthesis
MIKITVITVCYNAEKEIEKTIKSVLNQSYANMEYLIIDGKSDDNTLALVKNLTSGKAKNVQIYSEKDFGIYNAMNRGIVRASGDYVIFMNAGDSFYDDNVLAKVVSSINNNGYAIYFGKAYVENCANTRMRIIDFSREGRNYLDALLHMYMPCHQSIIAPLGCLKRNLFDEKYNLRSDFDWLVKCYRKGIRLVNMDFIVCSYANNGKTARLDMASKLRKESVSILKTHYPVLSRIMYVKDLFG